VRISIVFSGFSPTHSAHDVSAHSRPHVHSEIEVIETAEFKCQMVEKYESHINRLCLIDDIADRGANFDLMKLN